jgi:phytoene dehydrogenase-like protein
MHNCQVIVIGSGIGGLTAAARIARYGKQVLVCESHAIAGVAAHSFARRGFTFDSDPSFYCGLSDPRSPYPVRQVLDVLGESLPTVTDDIVSG